MNHRIKLKIFETFVLFTHYCLCTLMVKLYFTTNKFRSTHDIIHFKPKYFLTIACWPELVFGTNYVKPINELLRLIKILYLIPISFITFSRGNVTPYLLSKYLLIFSTRCFKTRYLCRKRVQLLWPQKNSFALCSVWHTCTNKHRNIWVKRKYHWAFPNSLLQDTGDAIWNLELSAILAFV